MRILPLPLRFEIHVNKPLEQVVEGLSVKTQRAAVNPFKTSVPFVGQVNAEHFNVTEAVWYSRSYNPVFTGAFEVSGGGTSVRVRAENLISTLTASIMWTAMLGLFVGGVLNLLWHDLEASALCGTVGLGFGVANALSIGFYYMKVEDGRRKLSSLWGASGVATGTSKGIGRNRGKPSD